jgi:ABC-type uncharacterized transport system auxiliary subunit
MSSEAQNTPYSIQEIKLAQWTAYFFVLEEDALVTIFQIDRACARRLRVSFNTSRLTNDTPGNRFSS